MSMDNFREVLIFGDMAARPVEELAVLTEEIFLPLLSNDQNHHGWPKVVAEDVVAHVQAFKNVVYQVCAKLSVVLCVYIQNYVFGMAN